MKPGADYCIEQLTQSAGSAKAPPLRLDYVLCRPYQHPIGLQGSCTRKNLRRGGMPVFLNQVVAEWQHLRGSHVHVAIAIDWRTMMGIL
jgi:hypothetical protein